MATVKGVNRTLADTPEGSNIMDSGVQKGKLRVMMDTYEASAIAIGTIIEMGEYLPKGARIIEVALMTDALGSSVTLAVGDYESAARYISATSHSSATLTRLNVIGGRQYEVDETTATATGTDRQIIITTAGGVATGTIMLEITYTQE